MKPIIVIAVAALFFSAETQAQSFRKTPTGVKASVHSVTVEIQFYAPDIVRVLKTPGTSSVKTNSLSVIAQPKKTALSLRRDGDELSTQSARLTVRLNMNDGRLAFATAEGEPLVREKEGGAAFTDFNDAGTKTLSVAQSFALDDNEAIYGLGEQQQGKMSRRNVRLSMVQGNTDDYIPFFLSEKGYGLFWDNPSPTVFIDTTGGASFRSDVGECIDYYVLYGGTADCVIAGMRRLTGEVPMFPLWTFGYWQSKERYKSQDELVGVVKKYRELRVPLDGIIQDWQYWGDNFHWNAMEFLNPEFPRPRTMVDDIHRLNAHLIISTWASFGPQTKQFTLLEKKNMLFDIETWPLCSKDVWPPDPNFPSGVKVYDAYNPEARKIYWDFMNKGLFSLGIDGWWLDSSEPDHLNFKPADFDTRTHLGSFRKVRNAFPLMHVGGVGEQQRRTSSAKRVFILTRSAYAGQQRYGANTWSGDVVASWEALRAQITAGLNFSLSNIPYWNSDIGGFFLWNFKRKLEDPDYRELYVRWLEFGAFCPMMRSHGTDAPREIYQFGTKGDRAYDAIEKFIRLRYDLLPYIYSASWDVTKNQSSMMRALVMDFAKDRAVLDLDNEYMFGHSILVCPVTTPMYSAPRVQGKDTVNVEDFAAVKKQSVYLPTGTAWYDFWTGDKHSGGATVAKDAPLDILPLYVRAGSVIPM